MVLESWLVPRTIYVHIIPYVDARRPFTAMRCGRTLREQGGLPKHISILTTLRSHWLLQVHKLTSRGPSLACRTRNSGSNWMVNSPLTEDGDIGTCHVRTRTCDHNSQIGNGAFSLRVYLPSSSIIINSDSSQTFRWLCIPCLIQYNLYYRSFVKPYKCTFDGRMWA